MARYIDIEAVGIGRAKREKFLVPEYADGWNNAIEIFENEPTADVVEVKHGEWIDVTEEHTTVAGVKMSGVYSYKCSLCGRREINKEPYCNCGAKMNGGKKGER